MPLILGTNSIKDTGYEVANSCRFNNGLNAGGDDAYMYRTNSSAGNRRTFTLSAWIKRGAYFNDEHPILASADTTAIRFSSEGGSNSKINVFYYDGSSFVYRVHTNAEYRDPSAWMHLVVAFDTTQSTASNRIKIYVNGTQVTSMGNSDYPSENYETQFNNNVLHSIARNANSNDYYEGYLSEVVMIDGQALDPTSFGEFDSDTPTIWKPIDVSGLTFGTNGFYLDFENASSLGADVSGNSNNFTVNNLTSVDQSTDTCTNNFATLNPLDVRDDDGRTLSEGNLNFTTSSGNNSDITSTIAVSGSGKWYFEIKISAQSGSASSSARFGIVGVRDLDKSNPFNAGNSYYIYSDGRKEDGANTTNSAHPGYSLNDIVQVALDLDGGNIYFGLNGSWGDNSGNFNQTFDNATAFFTSINTDGFWSAYLNKNVTSNNTLTLSANFGSPSFSISSGNSDANGYGNFEYAVPSGYYSLNTKNLSEFG